MALICLLAQLCPILAQSFQPGVKKRIEFRDIPEELREWAGSRGLDLEGFRGRIASIDRANSERELRGEFEHMIFYILQSGRFTGLPRIEPALSADELVRHLGETERSRFLAPESDYLPPFHNIPKPARERIADFIISLGRKSDDSRMAFFKRLLDRSNEGAPSLERRINAEYLRAMRFLYRKDFGSRSIEPDRVASYVAALYRDRGHSTDTQIEANFAVHLALASLKSQSPSIQLNKVLIVGPGLDFAPRTGLSDLFEPQSYQPFAVADALLSLKLAEPSLLQIHCVDINDRVIGHLQGLRSAKTTTLSLISGTAEKANAPFTDEFRRYFRNLGGSVGTEGEIEIPQGTAGTDGRLKKSLKIRPEIVGRISADCLNIITERYEASPDFDLVVVTNVFPYFKTEELLLALSNISAMLKSGGYLIHNELQSFPRELASPVGLPLLQARTVLIASRNDEQLFDGIAIHQRQTNKRPN